MAKRDLMVAALATVLMCVGCTSVQKGSAIGGGAGGTVGGIVGHFFPIGGAKGLLLGAGLGAVAGAITADTFYDDDDMELPTATGSEANDLSIKLQATEAEAGRLRESIEIEQAQRAALLEAHEKMRAELTEARNQLSGTNIKVSQEPKGAVKLTILSEVLFSSGKATLSTEGKAVLGKAAQTIRQRFPDCFIEVRGHTDNVPIRYSGFKSNLELSFARALAVAYYLIEKQGFPNESMSVMGFAETQPVASNATPEGRRMNRRAEIILRSKSVQLAAK